MIAVIDQTGNAAIYSYDAVGNRLAIRRQDATGSVAITFVNPEIGLPGRSVEIFGAGFSAIASENQVSFNGVAAPVLSSTSTQLTTQVPNGATFGLITVTAPHGIATSPQNFTVPGITISPTTGTVMVRKTQVFTASFSSMSDQRIVWKVNGVAGGNQTVGTITQDGGYTAPTFLPVPASVTIRAESLALSSLSTSAAITLLKDPALPDCTITWDGDAGDGLWETPTNWIADLLPGALDNVCIGSGTAVTLVSGNQSVNSLTSDSPISISGGSLDVASSSHIFNTLTLNLGTGFSALTGSGNVTISGRFTWSGGGMTGTGTTFANGGIALSGPDAKTLTRTLTNAVGQTATWTDGTFNVAGPSSTPGTLNNLGIFRVEHVGNQGLFGSLFILPGSQRLIP